ncbi:MAG: ComF family protein [Acidobacteriota bacterium]
MSAWSYQPPIDAVLAGLKFRRLEYLGGQLARDLITLFEDRLTTCELVVPVPLHWRRYLSRGYNQSAAIARPLAKRLGLPFENALRRCRATPAQSRLSRAERTGNLQGAFRIRRRARCRGRHVLLIDDVVTTGTTLDAAARCLLAAGASSVSAVTAARTPDSQ